MSLVSLMSVNNEVGSINPIAELCERVKLKSTKALFHTDAVQALGKIPINVKEWGVDLLTLSAHKIHGPKGIGALFIKRGVMIEPLMHGGAQERNRRGGTEAVALAVGFAKAAEIMKQEWHTRENHIKELYELVLLSLSNIPEIRINSPLDGSGVHSIINFSFASDILHKVDGEALLIRFDLEGIAVSNGSACTSGSMQPSHVLLAMGLGAEVASKSLRVSLSKDTTKHDVERFVEVLKKIIGDL
jgi:cysteine desulfurase